MPVGGPGGAAPVGSNFPLVQARVGFQTKLVRQPPPRRPVDVPPPNVFSLVKYDSPVGPLAAYVSPDPKNGKKQPAIVWITGGDCNSIDDVWSPPEPGQDDQSAAEYRRAGIVMMFPSLRGGNDNPGLREGFLGEVDDVIAAADHLAKLPYVDPERIYLGGHSTGGTLVLLVAESTSRFRAIFSFGPADLVAKYGRNNEFTPFQFTNSREFELRSPIRWLAGITSTTLVIEGSRPGNIDALNAMSRASKNPKVQFVPVLGATHFNVLVPMNRKIAQKIINDTGPQCNIAFTTEEVNPKRIVIPKKKVR
ncbi:MAG TPA: prolyl oligopeptidase family serine peptidase [Gemmataceae bacterium]